MEEGRWREVFFKRCNSFGKSLCIIMNGKGRKKGYSIKANNLFIYTLLAISDTLLHNIFLLLSCITVFNFYCLILRVLLSYLSNYMVSSLRGK